MHIRIVWQAIFHPPLNYALSAIAFAGVLYSLIRGYRLLKRGLCNPDDPDQSLWVVRGIRGGIVAIGLGSLIGGLLSGLTWPLIFAAVFLAEELFETGIMILALRSSRSPKRL